MSSSFFGMPGWPVALVSAPGRQVDPLGWLNSLQFSAPDASHLRALVPIAFAGLVVWSLWLYRFVLSRMARPIVTGHRATTSVVVPSFHEDPEILMRCLATWRAQDRARSSSCSTSRTSRRSTGCTALDDPTFGR